MEFEKFMNSEDFIDYHFFYICSRNNLYKFNQSKFTSTIEYFKYLKNVDTIDLNYCKEIFEKYDIPTIPSPKIKFYSYLMFEQEEKQINTSLNLPTKEIQDQFEFFSSDEENFKEPSHIIKTVGKNIPILLKNNIKNKTQNFEEDLEYENDSTYEFFSCEENDSENSEQEEIF